MIPIGIVASSSVLAKVATTVTFITGDTSFYGYTGETFGPNVMRLTNTLTGQGIAGKLISGYITDANGYANVYYGPYYTDPGTQTIYSANAGVHTETDTTLGSSSSVTIGPISVNDPL